MTSPSAHADPRAALALQLDRALAGPSFDPLAICRLGSAAHRAGLADQASRAFRTAVSLLLELIRRGDATAALEIEREIYGAFVKAVETEEHYERSFAMWRDALAALGRTFRDPSLAPSPDARGIGFVFYAGVVLGHSEVLFRLLESRDPALPVRLYVLGACQPDFVARAQKLGVRVEVFPEQPRFIGYLDRLRWLRARMAADGVRTAVWVAYPGTVTFAFAMRIAPVQVMWTLRYHPVRLPEVDGYITYGSWAEETRVFHGQPWTVCPVPLALDPRKPDPQKAAALRAKFPSPVLLGTLAREEKIDSRPFLESVAAILERNPQCGYIWTGLALHPGIDAFLRQRGVGGRCHFVGWVDTPLYASILDLFLETFPLGCGITGYQAMDAGVPLLSYLDSNTVFGMQYWSELMDRAGSPAQVTREMLDAYPVLCARDPQEYVALACRLIAEPDFRGQWREREGRFYSEEIAGIARYSKRFFATLEAFAAKKAA